MKFDKKTTIILAIIAVASFIVLVSTMSYAFFNTNVIKSGSTDPDSVSTVQIKADFTDGEVVNATIIPGDSFTKTFTVKNTGTSPISFKVVMNDVTNTFSRATDLTYVLYEDGTEISSGYFPTTTAALSDTVTIPSGASKTYTLTVTYVNSDEDQSADLGKSLSGKLFIDGYTS